MAALLLSFLSLAAVAYGAPAKCTLVVGGATSIGSATSGMMPSLISTFVKSSKSAVFAYQSVGSGAGITSFTAGTYCLAISDDPMTSAQDTAFSTSYPSTTPGSFKRFTIPMVVAVYNFFVNVGATSVKTASINLSWKDTITIFYAKTAWSATFETGSSVAAPSIAKTFATPISRSDGSGTTLLFKKFWAVGASNAGFKTFNTSFPGLYATGDLDSSRLPSTWYAYALAQNGGGAVCQATAATLGAIGYSQKGLCLAYPALVSVALKNANGAFISATNAQAYPYGALPSGGFAVADLDKTFSAFKTVMRPGALVPAIVSFEYMFIRKTYVAGELGLVAKKFAAFLITTTPGVQSTSALASTYFFYALPATYATNLLTAVNSVVAV